MRHVPLLTLLSTLLFAQNGLAMFEAHEWGTFTSLVGSNGISQNGLYHEDEPLPGFVHGFGETQALLPPAPEPDPVPAPTPNPPRPRPCHFKGCFGEGFLQTQVITQKMETPVIYFYSDQSRTVDVNVRFPEGVITETYPAPVRTSPSSGTIRDAANGDTTFHVDILPTRSANLPYADAANIYSHAREVASNVVRTNNEQEKFIFYRGIGRFQPRLGISSVGGGLSLASASGPSAIFLVHVDEKGDGQMTELHRLKGEAHVDPEDIAALRFHTFAPRKDILRDGAMRGALVSALAHAGLHDDEAQAMIHTWERGYLKVPGLRLLYILPREETDQVLPLTITPAPEALTRVFVGRIEVMLDTDEQAILSQVLAQKSSFQVASLGRFAEPRLRRVLEVYEQRETSAGHNPDYDVLQLLNQLIRQAMNADET